MTYDDAGNMLTRKKYSYTTGALGSVLSTQALTYGDSTWGDLLTGINGTAVTSDAIGNVLNDGTWTYTWKNGRQLATMSKSGVTWSFTYDASGMRTQRTNDSTTYNYTYDGSTLRRMTVGSNTLIFTYGANGLPLSVNYNGVDYYYVTNAQGDVIAIVNSAGAEVVSYAYDAWGNILSTNGSLASTLGKYNPFCYRGYVYDYETGLYYVSSRYYDPEIGRWINADNQIACIGGNIKGYNLFSYCFNNPINMSDPSGGWPQWIKNVGNAIFGATKTVVNFFSTNTHTISGQFQDGIFRGSGSVTGGYSDIMARGQGDKKVLPSNKEPSVTVGAFAKLSIVNATGKIGIGNDNAALSVKGVGDVLTASAQAGLKYQDGLGLTAKAKAAVVSGRATLELSVLGWQIEFGVTGDALSIGAEATIGIFDGAFEAKANASLGVGGGFVLRIKPPQ